MTRRTATVGPHALHPAELTLREALLFEAGIKLGGIFHQYLGTPVSSASAATLAQTITQAVRLQPYVSAAEVRIDPSRGGPLGRGRFRYRYLTAEMLHVRLTLEEGGVRVRAQLHHRPDLRYPLMTVEEVRERPRASSARRSARRRGRSPRRSGPSVG